jgi:hypothetical protein
LAAAIEAGPTPAIHGVVRWRIVDLVQWLQDEFEVAVGRPPLPRASSGLAPLLAEQPVQKQPGVPRRAVTGKQWPDPPLYVLQGRRPDFQRRLDRCTCHTMTSESR